MRALIKSGLHVSGKHDRTRKMAYRSSPTSLSISKTPSTASCRKICSCHRTASRHQFPCPALPDTRTWLLLYMLALYGSKLDTMPPAGAATNFLIVNKMVTSTRMSQTDTYKNQNQRFRSVARTTEWGFDAPVECPQTSTNTYAYASHARREWDLGENWLRQESASSLWGCRTAAKQRLIQNEVHEKKNGVHGTKILTKILSTILHRKSTECERLLW